VVALTLVAVLVAAFHDPSTGDDGADQKLAAGPSTSAPRVVGTTTSVVPGVTSGAVGPGGQPGSGESGDGSPPAGAADPTPGSQEPDPESPATTQARQQVTATPSPEPTTTAPPTTARPAQPSPTGLTRLPEVEGQVFALTNSDRAANGVPPVSWTPRPRPGRGPWARAV